MNNLFPKGWQPGAQEGAVNWDEDWDKFEDEGNFSTPLLLLGNIFYLDVFGSFLDSISIGEALKFHLKLISL